MSTSLVEGTRRPTGDYPDPWVDDWHEEDGGDDSRGVRPQIRVTTLQNEMDGLSFKGGYEAAWDDVNNAELIPARSNRLGRSRWDTSTRWVFTTMPR